MLKARKSKIVGRGEEVLILKTILQSPKAEFVAVYGRRRVGKTFLIANFFKETDCIFFYASGMKETPIAGQVEEFTKQISQIFYSGARLADSKCWLDAFEALTQAINAAPKNKKIVLFFDEFPWMATKKSKLLQALDYYWNRFWTHDSRVKLIICGSAASWITGNIINNKGGLYNRVTKVIELKPFNLAEARAFLKAYGVNLSSNHVLDLYMVFGGVPFYLAMIEKGLSAEQCIDKLCFRVNGGLFEEFDKLFSSLFDTADVYIKIIKLLAKHRDGLGQAEILRQCGTSEGGRSAGRLKDLEQSGFVTSFVPHKRKEKGIYYKIIDEFTLFHLNWIEPKKTTIKREGGTSNYWQTQTATPSWVSWAGHAFEAVCYKHVSIIRKTLGIEVGADVGTWRQAPKIGSLENGAQIDLLFDRKDDSITICEIKHSQKPFVIDKQYATKLLNKVAAYRKYTGTKKQIFIAMISANGLKPTMYSEELISGCVTLDDLFKG